MIINIASFGGRSHLLDLACELERHGHDVVFYSNLPYFRAHKYGLKKKNHSSYFFLSIPFIFLFKLTRYSSFSKYCFHLFFDYYLGFFSRRCDVFIGQSPMHVFALKTARKKYGATIILERGTSHVLTQRQVLKKNPALKGNEPIWKAILNRDLQGYIIADYISIGSEHVKTSFLTHGVPEKKLFVNPYGVNLTDFSSTKISKKEPYDIIFVGQWCFRKGCDLLTNVCKKNGYSILHVGTIVDLHFPSNSLFTHHDPVDQKKLINYYAQAKIYVLPSREEGLALVQLQAIASGLPLVCSKFTGGRDLKKFIERQEYIVEMEEYSEKSLNKCIRHALKLAHQQKGRRSYSKKTQFKQNLSWQAYGARYNKFLMDISTAS